MHSSTILYEDRTSRGVHAALAADHLWLDRDDFATVTGWKLEPAGLCRGDACVRTDPSWLDAEGRIDLSAFAGHLGQPIVRDGDAWAFGEPVNEVREQLLSLQAPDFTLPDLDGRLHSLSDFRGSKVLLFSWGSY